MTARILKQMTALAFVAGVAVLANAAPAKASVSVTYTTTGVFSGGNGDYSDGPGTVKGGNDSNGAKLTFTGFTDTTVGPVPPLTGASFGTIFAEVTGNGAQFTNINFLLTITQSAPSPSGGSVSFTDTLQGHLTTTSSGSLAVVFDAPTTQAYSFATPYGPGQIFYTVNPVYNIVPPSQGGTTSLQGSIDGVIPTPEPGTVALALTGLPLLGLAAWRRKRKLAV